jgi:magnesium chelatase accessory protein
MIRRLDWETDGRDWPNRAFSRFVRAGGLRWHVQEMGHGPTILLLHGTGASTHSWRALAPLLARHFTVVSLDLPGHGFTGTPSSGTGFSLPAVADAVAALLEILQVKPVLVAGHSAGAAVAARMCLDGTIAPDALVSLNGAFLPFPGVANDLFGPVARFLAGSCLASSAFALLAGSRPSVERMLRSTGSTIDAEGSRLYGILAGNSVHVAGALGLMANWDLRPLMRDLPRLKTRLILVVGSNDRMVPPSEAYRIRALVRNAEIVSLHGLGHLAHEERPEEVAALMERLVAHEAAA